MDFYDFEEFSVDENEDQEAVIQANSQQVPL